MDVTRLVFGLVAASPNGRIAGDFDELASWALAHAGVDLELRTAPTYKDLAASVREGSSDVAWLPPVVYALLAEAVTPLGSIVRQGRTSYTSALVVRPDSPVTTLEEMQDTRAGWVDPWSAAGYVVPRIELARAGLDPVDFFRQEAFLGTHRDAILALGRGDCDVAGTYARIQADGSVEGAWSELDGIAVRVVATFGAIPPDVLVVRRNLAPEPYERALEAIRAACTDPDAKTLVHAIFGGDELREGTEEGHATLRHAYESAVANGVFD